MKAGFLTVILCLFAFAPFVSAQNKEARKTSEDEELTCEEIDLWLRNLESDLENEPGATAFIIFYEGKHGIYYPEKEKYLLPRFGESAARTQTMQTRMSFLRLDRKKFICIDGGFRENYTVEFWIVPDRATPPAPTPTLEKMKYRKGKPADICREY